MKVRQLRIDYQRVNRLFQVCLREQTLLALRQCSRTREFEFGKRIHQAIATSGADNGTLITNALINMYSRCGNVQLARKVFESASHKDVVTWTCLLLGYVDNGDSSLALELFDCMDCQPDNVTYLAALKACTALATETKSEKKRKRLLEKGMSIHKRARERGMVLDAILANALVEMYSKCGDMNLAREVFDSLARKDVVAWTSLILGYVANGNCMKALETFNCMDCEADHVTYIAVLKACGELASRRGAELESILERGLAIHESLKGRTFASNTFVASTLVDMYSKCRSMSRAQEIFERLSSKSAVTWSCIILGYVENAEPLKALELFDSMDCEPSHVTFMAALKACSCLASDGGSEKESLLERGVLLHEKLRERGLEKNMDVACTLIDMYGKCGRMRVARSVFDGMPCKDLVTWTCLILGYVENGKSTEALELFDRMDCEPDHVACTAALKACIRLAMEKEARALEKGVAIHKVVRERGYESNVIVATSLVEMYCKCGKMELAREAFHDSANVDVVTWTCLILGYVESGQPTVALNLFNTMDCEPSCVSFVAAIKACTSLASERGAETQNILKKGINIHKQLKLCGYDSNTVVSNSLINMYSKCKDIRLARDVFEKMTAKDVVSWTSIITGYVENDDSSLGLELFTCMDCKPNHVTYVAALKACGNVGALQRGRAIHGSVCAHGMEGDATIATTLVDFYSRCGSMTSAAEVFNSMSSPDLISWNALMSGHSSLGDTFRVFDLIGQLQKAGFQLDAITFVSVLTACSHAGLVEEAKVYFRAMNAYGVKPSIEHYTCMVDMLGRANKIEEAVSIVRSMPFKVDEVTWITLLGACRRLSNMDVAKAAFDALVSGNKNYWASAYVLMSDTCRPSNCSTSALHNESTARSLQ